MDYQSSLYAYSRILLFWMDSPELEIITANHNAVLDIVRVICGKFIDKGAFRDVYEYSPSDEYVVKIETGNTGCNINEYQFWDDIR